jgi:hypothetical protein
MAQIQFKGKVRTVRFTDEAKSYDYVQIPELDRKHCDMAAMRLHPKLGTFANSDLFRAMLQREKRRVFGNLSTQLKLNAIPDGVTVDTSGFLAVVTFEV